MYPFANIDLSSFTQEAASRRRDPQRVARAGIKLVNGALRIRNSANEVLGNNGDDVFEMPITKPAEAIGAWISSLSQEAKRGDHCEAEMQEALAAAAEEVHAATQATPSAARLRSALYTDALHTVGSSSGSTMSYLPWILASLFGGVIVGILLQKRK